MVKILCSIIGMALVWIYIVEKHEPIGIVEYVPGGIGTIFIAAWTLIIISILWWVNET